MRNIIKRLSTLLSIIPLTTIMSFSSTTLNDTIVSITPIQLKKTNLIFAEHNKLLIENDLLKKQILNYKEDNALLLKTDSLRLEQISNYASWKDSLEKSLKKKEKRLLFWKIGGLSISSGLLLLLLFK